MQLLVILLVLFRIPLVYMELLLFPALGKGYTSNGRINNITVFDLKSNQVLSQIIAGTNPDAIMYDDFSKLIITCNGRSNDLSLNRSVD